MAVIVMRSEAKPGEIWRVARWAFSLILGAAIASSEDEPEIRVIFEQARALDGLHFHLLEPHQARAARRILSAVARRAAAGEVPMVIEGRTLDQASQTQFREASKELVQLLDEIPG
jgi:hypothetical protein